MKTFLKILAVFLLWRLGLFIVSALADNFLLYSPSFPYADAILNAYELPRRVYSWGNFDGVHYLSIIKKGYLKVDLIQAFFPVYPYLSKILNQVLHNAFLSSFLVSNGAFIGFLYVWYRFITEEFSKRIALLSTAFLLIFPTSFFFGALYTESLFMLFVIGTFWATKQKKYWIAALCIALASATRVTGILLLPAVLLEIVWPKLQLNTKKISFKKLSKEFFAGFAKLPKYFVPLAIVSLGSLGLFLYMAYLYKHFDDPMYFFHVQSEFGGGVRQENLVSYPRVLFRYLKILLTVRPIDLKYYSYFQDLVASTVGLGIILYSATKTRLSYVVFSLLAFVVPTLTGTFSSMPRYLLICFPIFIVFALWAEKSKTFKYIWFISSGILLVLNTVLFIQGYWVA